MITLAISKCYGKVRVLFFRADNSLISRSKSHVSRVRGLVVRCWLSNPEVSCSNPCVCAKFFYKYSEAEGSHFFRHYETFRLCEAFEIFWMSPKSPPFNFLIFCNRTNVENPKGSFFSEFPALWDFSKGIIFVLKFGFLRPSMLYPIFFSKKTGVFSMRLFKFASPKPLLSFCQKRNVLRELRTPQGFRHYASYRRPSKIFSKNFEIFFLNFLPVFLKGFSLSKMGFLLFSVGEEWFSRFMRIPLGIFRRCKIDAISMSCYPWFSVWYCLFGFLQKFASLCEARLRLCVRYASIIEHESLKAEIILCPAGVFLVGAF